MAAFLPKLRWKFRQNEWQLKNKYNESRINQIFAKAKRLTRSDTKMQNLEIQSWLRSGKIRLIDLLFLKKNLGQNLTHSRISRSSFYIKKTKQKDEDELKISEVDQVLSRCSDQRIVPFKELYSEERLLKAKKVTVR